MLNQGTKSKESPVSRQEASDQRAALDGAFRDSADQSATALGVKCMASYVFCRHLWRNMVAIIAQSLKRGLEHDLRVRIMKVVLQ